MASVTPEIFHAWLTRSGMYCTPDYSRALLDAYCAKNTPNARGWLWFVVNNERMQPAILLLEIEKVKLWARESRTKAAKTFLKVAGAYNDAA